MQQHTVPFEVAQHFDHLSDADFFPRFQDATHRTRPWRPEDESDLTLRRQIARESGWIVWARRDGLKFRLQGTKSGEIRAVYLAPGDGSLDHVDYGAPLGQVMAS